jgi:multicomponent Na+:H+ antiporter subunit D
MVKIWLEAFWKPHPDAREIVPVAGLKPACLAVVLMAALTLALGLVPEPLVRYAEAAAASLGAGGTTR